jgi:radical SAM protein with 4Fe4S-binding SPASM domain
MINFDELNRAYDERRFYALQLEIGDACGQGCSYCYMNALPDKRNELSDKLVFDTLEDAAALNLSAVEWLGGEPLARRRVFDFLERARDLGLRNNMWTGGLPFADDRALRRTAELCRDGLISVHLSSVDPETYKRLHPDRPVEDLDVILDGVRRLLELGYPAERTLNSVTFTGLQSAEDMIATIDFFEREFGVKTSLNVYHTYLRPEYADDELEQFIPSQRETAKVYKRFAEQYGSKRLPMNCVNKQYCSTTVAALNDASVTPCATIRPADAPKIGVDGSFAEIVRRERRDLLFGKFRDVGEPEACRKCALADECWGCRSRAYAAGLGVYGPDPRCFRGAVKKTVNG